MEIVAIAVALGLTFGLISGGSLKQLAETRFRWLAILFAGFVLQIVLGSWRPAWMSDDLRFWGLLASNGLVVVFLAANLRLPGMWLAAIGLAFNVAVIGANGAMPVSQDAVESYGGAAPTDRGGFKHEPLNDSTTLGWLADVIPIPPLNRVISVGDVVLACGILYLVFGRTRAPTPGRHLKVEKG